MTFRPLPWQEAAAAAFHSSTVEKGRIVVAATGSGKTAFGHHCLMGRGRILWLAHRQELVTQPMATAREHWPSLSCGIVMASSNDVNKEWTYASISTIKKENRLEEYLGHGIPAYVVVDEAHRATSKEYRDLLGRLRSLGCKFLGLTATPGRTDRGRLSEEWEVVYQYSLVDAVRDGVLVTPYAAVDRIPDLDLGRVSLFGSDFDPAELEREMARCHVVEHTVAAMGRPQNAVELPFRTRETSFAPRDHQAIVITVSVKQAEDTADALKAAGWDAAAVYGKLSKAERALRLELFRTGHLNALCAPAVLNEGTDLPMAKMVVFVRPTRSHTLYVQASGRCLRRYKSEERGYLLDLVGATKEHSLISAPVLVDGSDCPESADGQHRYQALPTGEGRCQDCGHILRCLRRGGAHLFKDGSCQFCGATQCPRSPVRVHSFISWEGKRRCVHCALDIPDPLFAMVKRHYYRNEPVAWHRLEVPGKVWGVDLGTSGLMFNVLLPDGWRPYLYARQKLLPLTTGPVPQEMARLLTDDVARQSRPHKGVYGARPSRAANIISTGKCYNVARYFKIWEGR